MRSSALVRDLLEALPPGVRVADGPDGPIVHARLADGYEFVFAAVASDTTARGRGAAIVDVARALRAAIDIHGAIVGSEPPTA